MIEYTISEKIHKLKIVNDVASSCKECDLHKTRINCVFSRGHVSARILICGEAPGEQENISGVPFVGKSGKLLDKLLDEAGISENDVYICNAAKCRPPDNRKPKLEEIQACRKYLQSQIREVGPYVILALGKSACEALLDIKIKSLTELRRNSRIYGATHYYDNCKYYKEELKIKVIPTYHPSALYRNKKWMSDFQEDLLEAKNGAI